MLPHESNPISESPGLTSHNLPDKWSKTSIWDHFRASMANRKAAGLHREVVVSTPISPTRVERNGQVAINFGANDYLGLAWHPTLSASHKASAGSSPEGTEFIRYGSGASPIVTGHTDEHARLVQTIAEFEETQSAIVYSSGYAANLGVVSALATRDDILFSDELNHASLIDGCRLSRAKVFVYPHGDSQALRRLVQEHRHRGRFGFVVTDSVFSMDGDLAPLLEIDAICQEFEMHCILDEAHATGVYGHFGRGLAEHVGISNERMIRIGTLSKAVGCSGGFVAGRTELIEWLVNHSRSWIYSTASPVPNSHIAARAIRLVQNMQVERTALRENARRLRLAIAGLGYSVGEGDCPIIPIRFQDPKAVVAASQALLRMGIYVPAIRPPTVPEGKSLLRVSLSAAHSSDDCSSLVEGLRQIKSLSLAEDYRSKPGQTV